MVEYLRECEFECDESGYGTLLTPASTPSQLPPVRRITGNSSGDRYDARVRIPNWRDLRKPAPLLAVLAISLLALALAFRAWDAYVERGLGRWAVDEVARQTDSAYRLVLGDLPEGRVLRAIDNTAARTFEGLAESPGEAFFLLWTTRNSMG